MKPEPKFQNLPLSFWAHVRSISQEYGYTARGTGQICIPTIRQIVGSLKNLGLGSSLIMDAEGNTTDFGQLLYDYFEFRADILNTHVKSQLMDAAQAKVVYQRVLSKAKKTYTPVMNKQKGAMKQPAYLTSMVNIIVNENLDGHGCDFDPRTLTTFTRYGEPLRTMSRRVDGAFPSTVNPIAIWEIKEYYYTTTFGSRVADGVYETLLDGMELEELFKSESVECKHYLIVDAYYTWWDCGRSYLCRMVDMMQMGYVDEVIFGREVETRLPELVKDWVALAPDLTVSTMA